MIEHEAVPWYAGMPLMRGVSLQQRGWGLSSGSNTDYVPPARSRDFVDKLQGLASAVVLRNAAAHRLMGDSVYVHNDRMLTRVEG